MSDKKDDLIMLKDVSQKLGCDSELFLGIFQEEYLLNFLASNGGDHLAENKYMVSNLGMVNGR